MKPLEHARLSARYNRWMNRNLYECSAKLTDAERKKDMGAFFKSIHGTLNHLLVGDNIWMGRFQGRPFPAKSLDQELHADFGGLRAAREAMDQRILDWVGTLTDDALAGELHYTSIVNPAPRVIAMDIAILHFFNHQTHHRGQVTTLLFQSGIDPGVTDLMWMAGQDGTARG